MTTDVRRTIINQGPGNVTIHLFITSDGAGGELSNYVIFDPVVDADPPVKSGSQEVMCLNQAWHNCAQFACIIGFNALVPTQDWVLANGHSEYDDLRYFGGIVDRAGAQRDGKVLLSTLGIAGVASSVGSLVLHFKKSR